MFLKLFDGLRLPLKTCIIFELLGPSGLAVTHTSLAGWRVYHKIGSKKRGEREREKEKERGEREMEGEKERGDREEKKERGRERREKERGRGRLEKGLEEIEGVREGEKVE